MPARFKTLGPACTCVSCTIFTDQFNRATEKVNGIDSTGQWVATPNLSALPGPVSVWEIPNITSPNQIRCIPTSHTGPYRLTWQGTVPRHFSATARVLVNSLAASGANFLMVYQADDLTVNTKRYAVELEFSDDISPTHGACGQMRLWDLSNLSSPVQLGLTVPVPGLAKNIFASVTMCYDPETQVLMAHVAGTWLPGGYPGGRAVDVWIHAHNCPSPPDPLDNSTIWLEFRDLGTLGPTNAAGGTIDSFSVSQSKNTTDGGYGYGYGYGYGDDDTLNCPCCGGGCGSTTLDLSTTTKDCRWAGLSGDLLYPGNDTITVTGTHLWKSSWSGVDDDCQPDVTIRIAAQVLSDGGTVARLRVNHAGSTYYEGWLTFESSLGADDGFIEIRDASGTLATVAVSGATIDGSTYIDLSICFDGFSVTLNCLGEQIEADVSDTGGIFGGLGAGGGSITFRNITFSHNIYSPNCPDCFTSLPMECCLCLDGEAPPVMIATLVGFAPGTCDDCGEVVNGTYACDASDLNCLTGQVLLDCVSTPTTECSWSAHVDGNICSDLFPYYDVIVRLERVGDDYYLTARPVFPVDPSNPDQHTEDGCLLTFQKFLGTFATEPDCFDLLTGPHDLTFLTCGDCSTPFCDWSSASIRVRRP